MRVFTEDIDRSNLSQNNWTKSEPIFGDKGQIKVLGYFGKSREESHKLKYIVFCEICSQDVEMFGSGLFCITKGELLKGKMPCGCSPHPLWNKDQYDVMCKRKATEIGYEYLGAVSESFGKGEKIKLRCKVHGSWESSSMGNFLRGNARCPKCAREICAKSMRKPEDKRIKSFFETGFYPEGTEFVRSERRDKAGCRVYWKVKCPLCYGETEATPANILNSKVSCDCDKDRPREAYLVKITNGELTFIKFGVSSKAKHRACTLVRAEQDCTSELLGIWVFPNSIACTRAEQECKHSFDRVEESREYLINGYTETAHICNTQNIIDVYEKHGGVRNE